MSASIRVMHLDDDMQRIQHVASCLSAVPTVTFVRSLTSVAEFDQKIQEANSVDIILIGFDLASTLHSLAAQAPLPRWVVVVSPEHSPEEIVQVLSYGARGEVPWNANSATYAVCLTEINEWNHYFSAAVAKALLAYFAARQMKLPPSQELALTELAERRTISEIVEIMKKHASTNPQMITERTVHGHIDSILRLLHNTKGGN